MKHEFKSFLALLLLTGVVGCSSTGGVQEGDAVTETEVTEEETTQEVPESQEMEGQSDEVAGADAMATDPMLQQTTVYFSFDRSDISAEFKAVLNAHASYLTSNPQATLLLEGHADERGTPEYNLALGERRANSAKQYLILQGANPDQISVISFGEEQPAAIGSDEDTMSKNRRAEIKYQTQVSATN